MNTNNKGFSLVELIVVIAIMAILAAVAIPTFAGFIGKANKAADEDFLSQVKYAVELANAGTANFAVTEIEIEVSDNGTFDEITYGETDVPKTAVTGEDTEIADVRSIIDWDYRFKNSDYKNKVVTYEYDETSGQWKVTTSAIPTT